MCPGDFFCVPKKTTTFLVTRNSDQFPFLLARRQRLQKLMGVEGEVGAFESTFRGEYEVTNVTRIAGDVVIHQRKGKLWPLCDLEIGVTVKVFRMIVPLFHAHTHMNKFDDHAICGYVPVCARF